MVHIEPWPGGPARLLARPRSSLAEDQAPASTSADAKQSGVGSTDGSPLVIESSPLVMESSHVARVMRMLKAVAIVEVDKETRANELCGWSCVHTADVWKPAKEGSLFSLASKRSPDGL